MAIPRLADDVRIDGVLDERGLDQAARLMDFSPTRRWTARPPTQATEVLVFYSPTAHPLRRAGSSRARRRCAPPSPTATGSTPRTTPHLPRHLQRRAAGARASPSTRSASRPTARWSKARRTRGGGFVGRCHRPRGPRPEPGLRVRVAGPPDRPTATRSSCASPSRACAYQRGREQNWGLHVTAQCSTQRPRGQLGAGAARGRVVPGPGGHAGGPHRAAARAGARHESGADGARRRQRRRRGGWRYDAAAARSWAATCAGA